jgi:hypothetical protein
MKNQATIHYVTNVDGVEYSKWFASIHYIELAENLLVLMKGGREKVYDYGLPFTVSLVAALESNLNDWLIVDTFQKHGIENYENIVNAYMAMSMKNKYRVAVSVMTDNQLQVDENSTILKNLDELIEVRNKFVHPKPMFFTKVSAHTHKPRKQRPEDHPFQRLKISECRKYLKAVNDFNKLFFMQIDKGFVKENSLIKLSKMLTNI